MKFREDSERLLPSKRIEDPLVLPNLKIGAMKKIIQTWIGTPRDTNFVQPGFHVERPFIELRVPQEYSVAVAEICAVYLPYSIIHLKFQLQAQGKAAHFVQTRSLIMPKLIKDIHTKQPVLPVQYLDNTSEMHQCR